MVVLIDSLLVDVHLENYSLRVQIIMNQIVKVLMVVGQEFPTFKFICKEKFSMVHSLSISSVES